MEAKVNWSNPTGKNGRSFGSIGFHFSEFTLDTILGGVAYRLLNELPGVPSYERETFHGTEAEAKAHAARQAFEFLQQAAQIAIRNPIIQAIDNATMFVFPAQFCPGDCPSFGGDARHLDVTVEKVGDLGWTVAREDGLLFDKQQNWDTPTERLTEPGSERFLWTDVEEMFLQVHFLHCG